MIKQTDIPYLVRNSQGIFENTNMKERIGYVNRRNVEMAKKSDVDHLKNEINNMKTDLNEIKNLLNALVQKDKIWQ